MATSLSGQDFCVRLRLHPSPLTAGKIDVIQLPATGNTRRQSLKIGYKRPHNQSQNQRKFLTVIVFLVLYSNFFIFPYDQLWESGPDVDDDGASTSREMPSCEMEDTVAEEPRYVAEQRQPMMALSWHGGGYTASKGGQTPAVILRKLTINNSYIIS